ncbi:MAG: perosamine synthetase [Geotoga sp.]|jgi:hypothetical protein|nr:perosamine synthetase [Geotoga sp.]
MNKYIPLSVPNLSLDILENVKETIETGWVSPEEDLSLSLKKKLQNM